MSANASWTKSLFIGLWNALNFSRKLVFNVIFIFLIIGFVMIIANSDEGQITVPQDSALVLNLRGNLVIEKTAVDPFEEFVNEAFEQEEENPEGNNPESNNPEENNPEYNNPEETTVHASTSGLLQNNKTCVAQPYFMEPLSLATDWIHCDKCNKWFHFQCIHLDNDQISEEEFVCPECEKETTA